MSESAVVVGASSGVGRAIATGLARRGAELVLAARHRRDLEALASDLIHRFEVGVTVVDADIAAATFDPESFFEACREALGTIDALLVTAGAVAAEDDDLPSPELVGRLVAVNFSGPVALASPFLRSFEERGRGTLVFFSSIAAAAPRSRNMVYSAAKASLESYAASLRHRYARTGIVIQTHVLGYVATPMSFGQSLRLPVARPEDVADAVVRSLGEGSGRRYLPRWWQPIVFVLRRLPWRLYSRLKF